MSDKYLLCSINEVPQMVDGEADLISETEKRALGGRKTHAYRLVPVELSVSVKARLIKRRSKNSPDAAVASGRPPVPDSGLASGEVVPKDSHREAEPGDQVAGVDASQLTEGPAHAPEHGREAGLELRHAGSVLPAEGATASPDAATEGTVCAVCDDPALPGKQFCSPHDIGGVKPEVAAELRRGKGQPRAAASKENPRGPLVPHD